MNVAMPSGFAGFRARYDAGRGALVWRHGVADLETPVAAFLKLAHGRPNSFLLESVEGGSARGRYSIIGMTPDLIWRCRNGRAEVNRHASAAPHAFVPEDRPALDSLRAVIAETHLDVPDNLPPMSGGLVGYLGYDMVRLMERLPEKNADGIGVPDALLVRPTLFAIFDNVNDELTLVAPVYPREAMTAEAAWAAAEARLNEAQGALDRPLPHPAPAVALPGLPPPDSNVAKQDFLAAVLRAKEYIAAGDAFQIGTQPALLRPIRAATFRTLSGAPPDQPFALPVLPRFRRVRRGGIQPRNPRAPAQWCRDLAPARRYPPARCHV